MDGRLFSLLNLRVPVRTKMRRQVLRQRGAISQITCVIIISLAGGTPSFSVLASTSRKRAMPLPGPQICHDCRPGQRPGGPARPLDGLNLTPYLAGQAKGASHDTIYLRPIDKSGLAVRRCSLKLVIPRIDNVPQLFNLAAELGEHQPSGRPTSRTTGTAGKAPRGLERPARSPGL